jgi:hypothetical protein
MRPGGRQLGSEGFGGLSLGGFCGVMSLLLAAAGCGGVGSASPPAGNDLYEGSFVAAEVREHGEVREFVVDPVRVSLEEDQYEDHEEAAQLRWDAGCNEFEALIEITSEELAAIPHAMRGPKIEGQEPLTPAAVGSDRSCSDAEHEQDEWLADFFLSDPAWTLDGDTLVLETDTTTMVLEKR